MYEVLSTSENTQRVGESLASARLCRGEACLARRRDIENNHNTCAPHTNDNNAANNHNSCAAHTTGESGFAPTLDHERAQRYNRACGAHYLNLHAWNRCPTVRNFRTVGHYLISSASPHFLFAPKGQNRYDVRGSKYKVRVRTHRG